MKKMLTVLGLGLLVTVGANNAEAAQCSVELKGPRGRVLDVLSGHGYTRQDACRNAQMKCQRAIRNGRRTGRRGGLTCQVVRPLVTRVCLAKPVLRTPGRRLPPRSGWRVFRAQETGVYGTGVKARACQKALRKCVTALRTVRGSRVGLSCVADNGARSNGRRPVVVRTGSRGSQIDPIPTPPRRRGGRN